MTIGTRLRALREAQGLSLEALGQRVGTTRQTIYKYETGVVENIPVNRLSALAEALHTTPAHLMGWDDLPPGCEPLPPSVRVPRVGRIACGSPILAQEHITDYDTVPKRWQADFTLLCRGDSMAPKIQDGDVVAIRRQPRVENGQIAAVRIGEEATLKLVYLHRDFLELRPVNPAYESLIRPLDQLEDVAVEGLAVGLWHPL